MKITNKKQKVIIMGAGLAGLSAGYELAQKGFNVEVYEKESQIGGLAKTITVNGFSFDTGPHRWYSKNEEVDKWMHKLLEKEIIKVPRLTRIYFDGKFFFYPIKLLNALFGIGPFKAFRAVFDYILARIRVKLFHPILITMEDGYISQFGRTLYETFFKRYSEKLWGKNCREISIDWVGQRTRGINVLTIIKDTFKKSKDVVSFVDEFSYPKKGIGTICERLKEEIEIRGGHVYTDSKIIEIKHRENSILSVIIQTQKSEKEINADFFISSIPLDHLVAGFSPKPKQNILDSTKKLTYRDELQIALFVDKSFITKDTWIYIHPKEIPFMRVMEMDNWSKLLSPPETTTLVFEVPCKKEDKIWKSSDRKIIEMTVKSYIDEFGLVTKKDILGAFVHRCEKEYPVYHLDYKKDLEKIKKHLEKFRNLQIVGRNGTFRYNNMDHSIEMGLYAAWNIIEGKKKYDIESVNIEREYLEEKRIENIEDELLENPLDRK